MKHLLWIVVPTSFLVMMFGVMENVWPMAVTGLCGGIASILVALEDV